MEEKIIQLDEDDLDSIVGGAFNQNAIAKYDLQVITAKNGAQALWGTRAYTETKGNSESGSMLSTKSSGIISESRLKGFLEGSGQSTLELKNKSGAMVSFTKDQAKELFS